MQAVQCCVRRLREGPANPRAPPAPPARVSAADPPRRVRSAWTNGSPGQTAAGAWAGRTRLASCGSARQRPLQTPPIPPNPSAREQKQPHLPTRESSSAAPASGAAAAAPGLQRFGGQTKHGGRCWHVLSITLSYIYS